MALLTLTDLRALRGVMSADELWDLCRDAAADAVRAPFGPAEREDCAADLYGDIIARIADETETEDLRASRTGRPWDVLRRIDELSDPANAPARQVCAMPRRDDARVTFTALRNRAHDWRRKLETAREYDALLAGADVAPEDGDNVPAEYIAAGARQDIGAARHAATEACRLLGMSAGTASAPSPVWCTFYVWAREREAVECAAELSIAPDAMHQRLSRARTLLRAAFNAPALIAALTDGTPREHGGALLYSLRDESQEARSRTRMLAPEWRSAPEDAAEVHSHRTAPDPEARSRRLERQTERETARALRRLARARAASRGRMGKWAVGATNARTA